MRPADYGRLLLLGALWGASFMFMRVAAPALGAILTAHARLLLGGLVLLAWFRWSGFDPHLARHWKGYLIVGTVNSVFPYTLYAFAAIHAPASLLAITNATAPMFSLAFGALLTGEKVTAGKVLGLLLGVAGVALIAGPAMEGAGLMFHLAIGASLLACCGYGLTGFAIQRFAKDVPSKGIAAGSQLAAALALAPLLPFFPPVAEVTPVVVACLLGLGILASGGALLLYFRLIADVGATRALSVTYLVPLFGVLWGWLLLGETLPASALAGGLLVLSGTVLVTRAARGG